LEREFTQGVAPNIVATKPTWDDFVEHTLNKDHEGWGDRLMVGTKAINGSNMIGLGKTVPRVALELRRIGWTKVKQDQWRGLANHLFEISERLNA
jgi:hypothetical protein